MLFSIQAPGMTRSLVFHSVLILSVNRMLELSSCQCPIQSVRQVESSRLVTDLDRSGQIMMAAQREPAISLYHTCILPFYAETGHTLDSCYSFEVVIKIEASMKSGSLAPAISAPYPRPKFWASPKLRLHHCSTIHSTDIHHVVHAKCRPTAQS
jgi:hypothetical protein